MSPDFDWQRYRPAHDNEPGLYIFANVPFGSAPRYVGDAKGLLKRLRPREKMFRDGKYTVLLPSFTHGAKAGTHRDFVLRWHEVGALPGHVFVPGAPGQTINPAGGLVLQLHFCATPSIVTSRGDRLMTASPL